MEAFELPRPSVHPRVGGEQPHEKGGPVQAIGSSPRGRGTDLVGTDTSPFQRFIPAWAGNSQFALPFHSILPVHPRVGGEQHLGENLS